MMEILLIIFAVVNFFVYHSIFNVAYFDLGKGLAMEMVFCVMLAAIEVGLILWIGKWLLIVGGIIAVRAFAASKFDRNECDKITTDEPVEKIEDHKDVNS